LINPLCVNYELCVFKWCVMEHANESIYSRINVNVMLCMHLKKMKIFLVLSIVVEQNGKRPVIRVVNQDVLICSDIRT
jgi:hypothetical protein